MVRNVNKKAGFSFVEILVSMVILSIVVLVMTNVMVATTKSHGVANEDDAGDMLALEKLSELQNHVIPAEDGSDFKEKDEIYYNRVWSIDKTQTPPKVTVTVKWSNSNEVEDSTSVIGYLSDDNTCPDQGGANKPITALNVYNQNETTINDSLKCVFTSLLPTDAFIAKLEAVDEDISSGKDIITYEITSLNADSMFYISNDTLKAAKDLPMDNAYNIDIKATDCHGASKSITLHVAVTNPGDAPIVAPLTIEVNDETAMDTVIGTMVGECKSPIHWSIYSGSGISINDTTGEIKLTTPLNYEVQNKYNFLIKATNSADNNKDTVASLTILVKDTPEKPTDIKFMTGIGGAIADYSAEIASNASTATVVGQLDIIDEDTTQQIYNITIKTTDASGHIISNMFQAKQYANNVWKIKPGIDLDSYTGTYTLKVTLQDIYYDSSDPLVKDFTVTITGGGVDCSAAKIYSQGTAYSNGESVKTSTTPSKKYTALTDVPSGIPQIEPGTNDNIWKFEGVCQ